MQIFSRFYPAIFSAIALLGTALPFNSGSVRGNLLDFPNAISDVGQVTSLINPSSQTVSTGTATAIAWLVYLVPVLAIVIIVLNFRGAVDRALLLFVSIAWLLILFFVPYFSIMELINSNPLLRGVVNFTGGPHLSADIGVGGWLIFAAAIGLLLSSTGLFTYKPNQGRA